MSDPVHLTITAGDETIFDGDVKQLRMVETRCGVLTLNAEFAAKHDPRLPCGRLSVRLP